MAFQGLRGFLVLAVGLLLAALDFEYIRSGFQTPALLHAPGHPDHPAYTESEVLLEDWKVYDAHHHLFDGSQPRVLFKLVHAMYILKPHIRHSLTRFVFGLFSGPLSPHGNSRHAHPNAFGGVVVFENFTVSNMKTAFAGHNVVRTTHVMTTTENDKAGYTPIEETRWCAEQKVQTGYPSTIVAFIDLLQPVDKVKEDIELHKAASCDVKSVRYFLTHDDDPEIPNFNHKDVFLRPQFLDSFEALGQAGLFFDAWLYHPQLSTFAKWLEEKKPSTEVVIEHIGFPLRAGQYSHNEKEVIETWRWGLRDLSGLDNVIGIKFSGVGMLQSIPGHKLYRKTRGRRPATVAEIVEVLTPFVHDVVEFFGVDRVMFASNFPVDSITVTYQGLFNAYKQILVNGVRDGRWLEVQAQAMLYDNALRIYG